MVPQNARDGPAAPVRHPGWRQLRIPNVTGAGIGLNESTNPVSSSTTVITFVVNDIDAVRNALEAKGVDVSPIDKVAHGVQLAFFQDPDNNSLGLRQNPEGHPSAGTIGHA